MSNPFENIPTTEFNSESEIEKQELPEELLGPLEYWPEDPADKEVLRGFVDRMIEAKSEEEYLESLDAYQGKLEELANKESGAIAQVKVITATAVAKIRAGRIDAAYDTLGEAYDYLENIFTQDGSKMKDLKESMNNLDEWLNRQP